MLKCIQWLTENSNTQLYIQFIIRKAPHPVIQSDSSCVWTVFHLQKIPWTCIERQTSLPCSWDYPVMRSSVGLADFLLTCRAGSCSLRHTEVSCCHLMESQGHSSCSVQHVRISLKEHYYYLFWCDKQFIWLCELTSCKGVVRESASRATVKEVDETSQVRRKNQEKRREGGKCITHFLIIGAGYYWYNITLLFGSWCHFRPVPLSKGHPFNASFTPAPATRDHFQWKVYLNAAFGLPRFKTHTFTLRHVHFYDHLQHFYDHLQPFTTTLS